MLTRNEVTASPKNRQETQEGATRGRHTPHLTIKGASQETSKGQASTVLGASDPRGFLLGPYFTITHPDPPRTPWESPPDPIAHPQPFPDPIAHPQHAKPLTHGPPTEEVDLEVVVKDDNCVLLPKAVHGGLVGEESALRAGPPLQEHDQLCGRAGSALRDACPAPPS